jgi:hypothetical protein
MTDEQPEKGTRTYEVRTTEGSYRIDIPADWKVTYGPVSPGTKGSYGEGNALRIYESDTKQRAIFTGVQSFRDVSIPVQRLMVKRKGSEEFESDTSGNRRGRTEVVVERKWVSVDEFDGIVKPEEGPF